MKEENKFKLVIAGYIFGILALLCFLTLITINVYALIPLVNTLVIRSIPTAIFSIFLFMMVLGAVLFALVGMCILLIVGLVDYIKKSQ